MIADFLSQLGPQQLKSSSLIKITLTRKFGDYNQWINAIPRLFDYSYYVFTVLSPVLWLYSPAFSIACLPKISPTLLFLILTVLSTNCPSVFYE